jgi:hypothetical protein
MVGTTDGKLWSNTDELLYKLEINCKRYSGLRGNMKFTKYKAQNTDPAFIADIFDRCIVLWQKRFLISSKLFCTCEIHVLICRFKIIDTDPYGC